MCEKQKRTHRTCGTAGGRVRVRDRQTNMVGFMAMAVTERGSRELGKGVLSSRKLLNVSIEGTAW